MRQSRADRIIADWDRVSRQANRPEPPRRTRVGSALPGPTLAVTTILAIVLVAGIGLGLTRGDHAPGAGGSAVRTDTWGPLAVVPPSSGVDAALSSGVLHITDSCVFLEEAGNDVEVLVWPADRTTWNADEHAVGFENLDGSRFTLRDGDQVSFGGGGDNVAESGISGEDWVARTEWVAPPAPACPLDARWFVGEVVADR